MESYDTFLIMQIQAGPDSYVTRTTFWPLCSCQLPYLVCTQYVVGREAFSIPLWMMSCL